MAKNFYKTLSKKYREKQGGLLVKEEIEAYVEARMPATYAAIYRVFLEIKLRSSISIKSICDVGAGPGTGVLAALEVFPEIERATCIEQNSFMIREAQKRINIKQEWIQKDACFVQFTEHDLILFSYSFGEFPEQERLNVLKRAFQSSRMLVCIEPGTPQGFANIHAVRKALLQEGGKMVAPCPHQGACPLQKEDWCHFSVRLERSKEHQHLKEASRGWEDEKFSYVVMTKEEGQPASARILRHPRKYPGHVVFQLCTKEGLQEKTLSRKEKEEYKRGRKLEWGDPF